MMPKPERFLMLVQTAILKSGFGVLRSMEIMDQAVADSTMIPEPMSALDAAMEWCNYFVYGDKSERPAWSVP